MSQRMDGNIMRDTIDMAREAGLNPDALAVQFLERFEALVRADERNRTWTQAHWTEYEQAIVAAEREACIQVIKETKFSNWFQADCIEAIRAREEQMTKEDIIRMAREVSNTPIDHHATPELFGVSQIERFAELVRADEREACERVAGIALLGSEKALSDRVLKAIRARNNT